MVYSTTGMRKKNGKRETGSGKEEAGYVPHPTARVRTNARKDSYRPRNHPHSMKI